MKKTVCVCADGAKGPGDSGNMKDDEGRNNLKHKNLLQPCFVNFPANLSRAPSCFHVKLAQN